MYKSTNFDMSDMTTAQAGIIEANVHRLLQKEFASYLEPYNLTAMEWYTLGHLYENDKSVKLSEIAKVLQTTLPYLTNLIHGLEKKGLVERVVFTNDGRAKLVRLMPAAKQLYPSIEANLRNKLRQFVYPRIGRDDFATYIKVLRQLSDS